MKTTIDLPNDLMREVKIRAVLTRRTARDLVADLLKQGLGLGSPAVSGERPTSTMVTIGDGGVPVIRCAPAARMSVAEMLALDERSQNEEDCARAGLTGQTSQ
jgi:hypothetical protein